MLTIYRRVLGDYLPETFVFRETAYTDCKKQMFQKSIVFGGKLEYDVYICLDEGVYRL